MKEVPEIRGVVKGGNFIPGMTEDSLTGVPRVYELLAGCDVRADIFYSSTGPLAMYKQQSLVHIEFPRGYEPKILAIEQRINAILPRVFVDACSGIGTLGLTAAQMGVKQVIMNDAWYAAAFWAAYNLNVNREYFHIDTILFHRSYDDMKKNPMQKKPVRIAESEGEQIIQVFQGDFRELYREIPRNSVLTAIDLFEKDNPGVVKKILKKWQEQVGGQVFIP